MDVKSGVGIGQSERSDITSRAGVRIIRFRTSVFSVSVVATPRSTHFLWLTWETDATAPCSLLLPQAECELRVALGCLSFAKQVESPTLQGSNCTVLEWENLAWY